MRTGTARGAAVLLLAAVLLSGCTVGSQPTENLMPLASDKQAPPVVALLDTGINPYHLAFQAAPGAGVERSAAAFGAEVVHLSTNGSQAERVKDDGTFWSSVEPRKLYAFAGTRVMVISFGHMRDTFVVRDHADTGGHGTSTASLVAREAEAPFILMVQVDVTSCDASRVPVDCPIFARVAEAMRWIADQPWIDVVSVSLGTSGNPPASGTAFSEVADYVAASRLASEQGKIIVNSAGNSVTPPLFAYRPGPPWIIAVGGAEPASRGDPSLASRGGDVVANHTEWTAAFDSVDGYDPGGGTSYSTPIVAAVLAQAIHHVRAARDDASAAARNVAPAELRAAMNATAILFATTDWDPTKPASNDTFIALVNPSAPVLVPGFQQGWGYIDGAMAGEVARRVLEQDFSIPPEKSQTATYMAQGQSLREEYWKRSP